MKKYFFISALMLSTFSANSQLDSRDFKLEDKAIIASYDGVLGVTSKDDKVYFYRNQRLMYTSQNDIDVSWASYFSTRGKMYRQIVGTDSEGKYSIYLNFKGMSSLKTLKIETKEVAIPGSMDVKKVYTKSYTVYYPVIISIYKEGKLIKTVDFLGENDPLVFRFTKNMTNSNLPYYDEYFNSIAEIDAFENSGLVNKLAEKFVYFKAEMIADEVIKNCFGTFDYDLNVGPITIKKKKSGDYIELSDANKILEEAVLSFKKKKFDVSDSLAAIALKRLETIYISTDPKYGKLGKDEVNYNMLICYLILGNLDKANELFQIHMKSEIQQYETSTGNFAGYFLKKLNMRNQLKSKEVIHVFHD